MPKKYITIVEFAARFGVTPRAVNKWANDPRVGLPGSIQVGNRKYFDIQEIEEWEAVRKTKVREAA